MLSRFKKRVEIQSNRRDDLLSRAFVRFISKLPSTKFPDESQIRSGLNEMEGLFQSELCSESWLTEILGEQDLDETQRAYLALEFTAWMSEHPLQLPTPTFSERLSGFKLAFATMLGTLGGALLLSGAFRFFAGDPQTGFTLGSILGAGGMVLAMWYASENKKVRRYLTAALGVASAAEVAILFGKISGIGMVWSALSAKFKTSGFLNGLKRIFIYISIILVLRLSVRKPVFNRIEYEKNLQICLSLWLDHALTFLKQLARQSEKQPQLSAGDQAQVPKKIGAYLLKLHQSSREDLPESAAEMLIAARNLGFDGLAGEPLFISGKFSNAQPFVWEKSLEEKFNTLGIIEEGDTVFVESQPVIQNGKVIEKGSVRKLRRQR